MLGPLSEAEGELILGELEVRDSALLVAEEAAEAVRAVPLFELLAFLSFVVLVFDLLVEELMMPMSESAFRAVAAVSELLPILAQLSLIAGVNHSLVSLIFIEGRGSGRLQVRLALILLVVVSRKIFDILAICNKYGVI